MLRPYLSLFLLFVPAILFGVLLFIFISHPKLELEEQFPYLPWQFFVIIVFGIVATAGGVLDWRFHRFTLQMKISRKERDAEAAALGLGGVPMFILMWWGMMSNNPNYFLIPIILVLLYTVVAICYDEFVFHINRCGKLENIYHRMLVFGNGVAWLAWFHFIFCR